jgi:nucleoside-diphosphate-sugar epimerase
MNKALVIGSEGNVGAPLVRHLRANGYDVLESDIKPGWRDRFVMADINHPVDLLPAFDWGPDVVFLLSAIVSRVTCEQASSVAIATNLGGVNNVLALCERVGARLVFFSTSEVYGNDCEAMDEAASVPRPNNRYGLSKLLGEQLVEYEVRTHGLRAVSLRPFMIYDESEDLGDHRSAMIRFTSELAMGRPIEVHRGAARSWLHISDAVRAIERAAHVDQYAVINIGHPDVTPMEDLAEKIRRELGAAPDLVEVRDLPPRMTLVKRPTLERQRTLLGVTPAVGLDEGIARVCRGVRERLRTSGDSQSVG